MKPPAPFFDGYFTLQLMDGLLTLSPGGPASYPHLYSSGTTSSPSLLVLCAIRSILCQSSTVNRFKILQHLSGPQCCRNDSRFWLVISAPPFPSTSSTLPNMRIFNLLQIRLLLPLLVLVDVHAERDYTIKTSARLPLTSISTDAQRASSRETQKYISLCWRLPERLNLCYNKRWTHKRKESDRAGFYGAVSMFPFVCVLPLSTCPCFYQADYHYIVRDSQHHNAGENCPQIRRGEPPSPDVKRRTISCKI